MNERHDVALPIVFPDYLISVATPAATIDLPEDGQQGGRANGRECQKG